MSPAAVVVAAGRAGAAAGEKEAAVLLVAPQRARPARMTAESESWLQPAAAAGCHAPPRCACCLAYHAERDGAWWRSRRPMSARPPTEARCARKTPQTRHESSGDGLSAATE